MDIRTRMTRSGAAFGIALALILALLLLLTSHVAAAGTDLQPGDIAIIGFNADNPDEFAFVLLTDVAASTTITFTDNGWQADNTFRGNEGHSVWTAATALSAGAVVNAPVGTMAFSASGDQILAYQGADSSPSFIYAVNSEGTGWQSDATSSNTSALPSGLTDGATAIALNEIDNAKYDVGNGTAGTKAALLALISNNANWVGSDSARQDLAFAPFTVTTGPNTDLELDKTVSAANPDPGDTITYTLYLTNNAASTADATNIQVVDYLPDTTTLVENVSNTCGAIVAGDTLTWTVTSLAIGAGVSCDVSADIRGGANGTSFVNLAEVYASDQPDADSTPGNLGTAPAEDDEASATVSVGTPVGCGTPATFIHTIQGSGASSPEEGNTHTIEGVVVGDFQGTTTELSGFFLQEEASDADSDPATSEGIFVFDDGFGVDVDLGDVVRVTGEVDEAFGLTELKNMTDVTVCSTGHSIAPTDVTLPLTALDDYEKSEGMLVQFSQELAVTEVYNLGRFDEVWLAQGGPLFNPTNVVTPGSAANTMQAENDLRRLLLDDGSTVQNPDPIAYPDPGLSAVNTLRIGDTTTGLVGVLSYAFGDYRLQPTSTPTFVHANPRPAAGLVRGWLRVAGFNVLNYFNGPTFPTARGADTPAEFDRQRRKIITAVLGLDADVIGLIEMENDAGTDNATQDLVDGLNAIAGANTYDYVDTGTLGSDAIKVALIYRPAAVTPQGTFMTDSDPIFSRPPLAQTFEQNSSGERFSVVVNHFKSKGCGGATGMDEDQGDGQGCYNHRRTLQATQLLTFTNDTVIPTSGDPDVLVLGDLNSYAREDPITTLTTGGLTSLTDTGLIDSYSYAFEGQLGDLDYALATTSLVTRVTGVTIWHINADEPRVLDYNEEFKSPGQITSLYSDDAYRASDHDPVIVGLDLVGLPEIYLPFVSRGF
jgi:uncharacterized repeat protein (TIGR01451 family)